MRESAAQRVECSVVEECFHRVRVGAAKPDRGDIPGDGVLACRVVLAVWPVAVRHLASFGPDRRLCVDLARGGVQRTLRFLLPSAPGLWWLTGWVDSGVVRGLGCTLRTTTSIDGGTDMGEPMVVHIDEIEGGHGGVFKPVGRTLGVTAFGVNVEQYPQGHDQYPDHDHAKDGQEEVYYVISGQATLTIDGDDHIMPAGSIAYVPPATAAASPRQTKACSSSPSAAHRARRLAT